MTVNKNFIDFQKIKQSANFEKILAFYSIKFEGESSQKTISCPFHEEKTPSCKVNTEKKVFNCFGCGAGGNILDFVTLMENKDPKNGKDLFVGAKKAASIMKIDTPKQAPQEPIKKKQSGTQPKMQKTNSAQNIASGETINPPLKFALSKLDQNHSFFENRAITQEQVNEFGLGFCAKGIMKDRIVFPIHDHKNNLIAYSGRWADENLPEDKKRYKLPEGFKKSHVLYNLNRLLEQNPNQDTYIVVEGFWSVIKLHSENQLPVVACFGSSFSKNQLDLLVKAGAKKLIFIFDADEAGKKGAEKAVLLSSQKLYVKNIILPDGIKPDDMDNEYIELVKSMI